MGWAKRTSQQTVGVQLLEPLTIKDIRLAAGDVLNVARIDQLYFESTSLEQFEQRDPVNTSRFHRHGSDATLLQPSGQGLEVTSKSAKLAHRKWIPSFGYCHQVLLGPDINPRSIQVHVLQLGRQFRHLETFALCFALTL